MPCICKCTNEGGWLGQVNASKEQEFYQGRSRRRRACEYLSSQVNEILPRAIELRKNWSCRIVFFSASTLKYYNIWGGRNFHCEVVWEILFSWAQYWIFKNGISPASIFWWFWHEHTQWGSSQEVSPTFFWVPIFLRLNYVPSRCSPYKCCYHSSDHHP